MSVRAVSDGGLATADRLVSWSSIHRVELITGRGLGGTWYRFEIRSEEGPGLVVDGGGPMGELFLAHTYHLRGFDHDLVAAALSTRTPQVVCFDR